MAQTDDEVIIELVILAVSMLVYGQLALRTGVLQVLIRLDLARSETMPRVREQATLAVAATRHDPILEIAQHLKLIGIHGYSRPTASAT